MLPREYRLKKRKVFNYIYRSGRSTGCDILSLVYCYSKTPKAPHLKVGFSASKKVGNSVKRHRAVRVMREAVRPLLGKFRQHNNYIFVAKENIFEKSVAEIQKSCEYVVRKAGLLIE